MPALKVIAAANRLAHRPRVVSVLEGASCFQCCRMFRNTFQSGFLSILYSIGSKPLQIWDKQGKLPRHCQVHGVGSMRRHAELASVS